MFFNSLVATSIIAFAAAAPVAQVDWSKVDYDFSGVDWNKVDYSNVDYSKIDWSKVDYSNVDYSKIDWSKVDYSNVDWSKIDWSKVNYGAHPNAPQPPVTTPVAPAPQPTASVSVVSNQYTLVSFSDANKLVNGLPLLAQNNAIRLGPGQASNAPAAVSSSFAPGTGFVVQDGRANLAVTLPGGQQVFVDSEGRLAYTPPRSANTGTGSTTMGFSVSPSGMGNNVNFRFNGKDGFLACPATSSGANAGQFDVYVAEKTTRTDCTAINVVASASTTRSTTESL